MRTATVVSIIMSILLVAAIACQASPASQAPPAEQPPLGKQAPIPPAPEATGTPMPTTPAPIESETPRPGTPAPQEPAVEPLSAATITGAVTYRERIALTPDAVVTVMLSDVSRMGAEAITIAEQVIENPGQVPVTFEIEYEPSTIDPRFTYAIQVRITDGDRLAFINDTTYQVITRDNPTHVDMVLIKVGEAPAAFEVGPCITTLAAQMPIEFEYIGTIPTGLDGINKGNCSFTKAVASLTVTTTGPATHSEVFTLEEPATEVSFPPPEGTLSISTAEIVPPGEYQREMIVTSVDGDTLVISDLAGIDRTVTIIEPMN